jgi:hypothetical protein
MDHSYFKTKFQNNMVPRLLSEKHFADRHLAEMCLFGTVKALTFGQMASGSTWRFVSTPFIQCFMRHYVVISRNAIAILKCHSVSLSLTKRHRTTKIAHIHDVRTYSHQSVLFFSEFKEALPLYTLTLERRVSFAKSWVSWSL